MAQIDVLNIDGNAVASCEVGAGLLSGKKVNLDLIWEAVKMQRANWRSGTASTKTRGQIAGSTRKIYRQKGTGNARHGDIKAPIFVGGGTVWGPHVRDYSYRMSRSSRKGALKNALLFKYQQGAVKVVQDFNLPEIKTKAALDRFKKLGVSSALLVIEEKNDILEKSIRNLPFYKAIRVEGVNVFDLLKYDYLVFTQSAFLKFQERFL